MRSPLDARLPDLRAMGRRSNRRTTAAVPGRRDPVARSGIAISCSRSSDSPPTAGAVRQLPPSWSKRMQRPRTRPRPWKRFVAPAVSAQCSGAIRITTRSSGRARPSILPPTSARSDCGGSTVHRNRRLRSWQRSPAPNGAPPDTLTPGSTSIRTSSFWTRVRNYPASTVGIGQSPSRLPRRRFSRDRLRVGWCGEHGLEDVAKPCGREADRAVGGAVVEPELVARGVVEEAAREDDVRDVAGALVRPRAAPGSSRAAGAGRGSARRGRAARGRPGRSRRRRSP